MLLSAVLSSSIHFERNHSHLEHSYNHNDYNEAQKVASERRVQFEGNYYGFNEDDFLAIDEPSVPLESEITFIVKELQPAQQLYGTRLVSESKLVMVQVNLT